MPELETLLGRGLIRRAGADFVDLSTIEAIDSVATEAARLAIIQTPAFRGRVVRQTGGYNAGYYIADGAGAWERIGDARERSATHVDVRDFGAACDGSVLNTLGTDDTAAVRAAVQSCQSTGRTLYFPGICKITDEIVCTGRIRIEGADVGGLHQVTTGSRCLAFAPSENSLRQSISNMSLVGGLICIDWSNENGAVITHNMSRMERLDISPGGIGGDGATGIRVALSMLGCRHSGIFIIGGFDYGIDATDETTDILGASHWDGVTVLGGAVYSIRSVGGGAPACVWVNPVLSGCQGSSMYLRDVDFTLVGAHFEGNGDVRDEPDIYMIATGSGSDTCRVRMQSCYFSGKGPAQSDNRITFNSSHCQLAATDTYLPAPNTINVTNAGQSSTIEWTGLTQPIVAPADQSTTNVCLKSADLMSVATLETDAIAGRSNNYLSFANPISGALGFTHGTPAVDLAPGIRGVANARALSIGINSAEISGVNAAYDTGYLRFETRNEYQLAMFLGNAAGEALEVIQAFGKRGYQLRAGAMTPAAATGNRTIDKGCGSIRIAAGNSSVVLTNDLIKVNGIYNTQIYTSLMTNDATAKTVVAVRGNGECTFTLNAAATGEVEIAWYLVDSYDDTAAGSGADGGQLDFSNENNSAHIPGW